VHLGAGNTLLKVKSLYAKEHLNMKTILTAAAFVVLALWIGYALGYHHGVRNEQKAWSSTYQLDRSGQRIYNRWPGSGRVVVRPVPAVNVPDPRNSLVK
jgi:hypothetical protein